MILQRLRILPLLIVVIGLAFIVRVGEFAGNIEHTGLAFAQQESHEEPPPIPKHPEDHKNDITEHDNTEQKDHEDIKTEDHHDDPIETKEWKDAADADFDYSDVKADLYKDLAKRREKLEKQERTLATREAVMEAAERELNQKIREMTAIRHEIEALLKTQSEQEQEQILSLVKIYESMKAKDAARIFNTLDMDVLISVLSQMSERKSAPILAEMTAERARAVTILMAQQKKFPEIPPQ